MTDSRAQSGSIVVETVLFGYDQAAVRFDRLGSGMHSVSDPVAFRRLLAERPSVVVVFAPPATDADIGVVAHERSCRRDMRAVLVDRPIDSAERLAALRAGFDEALDDGIAASELAGRISLLAERAQRERRAPRIALGERAQLDLDTRSLIVDGKPVHLRPREFELLAVLAEHPGHTFDRLGLLAAVGAELSIHQQRTVDVHIRWLRAKLELAGAGCARLETVRGVGYRLEPASEAAFHPAALTKR
jgi:DNA-binding response OmpR family regulator